MSQNLAFKASAMNSFKQQNALTNSVANLSYAPTMPEDIRASMRVVIRNAHEKAYRQLRSEAKLSMIPMDQQIAALKAAPLTDKRNLLDSMPIINVPIGAAFLGVAEADLHDLNSHSGGVFGDMYMRRRCNSMNELLLIAQNPGWLRYRPDGLPPLDSPDAAMLYEITYVDIWTASAYTNMSWDKMQKEVRANGSFHGWDRTYRVSDLEKIRIANLSAQQQ